MLPLLIPIEIRHDLQTLHERMARQDVRKEYDAMVALTTARFMPEFRYRKLDGPDLTLLSISDMRDDELARAAVGRGDGPIRWTTRLDDWARQGDRLTLVAHHAVEGSWLKADGRHPVRFQNTVRETWIRKDGEWKALRLQEVWLRGTMDGRTMQKEARPGS